MTRGARIQTNSGVIQNASDSFDEIGNLRTCADSARGFNLATETFGYDGLNRLTSISGGSNKAFAHDNIGNITSKSGVTGHGGT